MEHPITRRHAIALGGTVGAGIVAGRLISLPGPAGAQTADCVLTGSRTEGPYFVDEKLNRSDIRSDPATGAVETGVPLTLTLTVVNVNDGCAPAG